MSYISGPTELYTSYHENKKFIFMSDIHSNQTGGCTEDYYTIIEYIEQIITQNKYIDIYVENAYNKLPYIEAIKSIKSNLLADVTSHFSKNFYDNENKPSKIRFHSIDIRYNTAYEISEPMTKLFFTLQKPNSTNDDIDIKIIFTHLLQNLLFPKPIKDFFLTPLGKYYNLIINSSNFLQDYSDWLQYPNITLLRTVIISKLRKFYIRTNRTSDPIKIVDAAINKYHIFLEKLDNFTSTRGDKVYHKVGLQLYNLGSSEYNISKTFMDKLQNLWSTGSLFMYYKILWDKWNRSFDT